MPTPADIPAQRRAPVKSDQPAKPARQRRNCSNTRCHKRIYLRRYACNACWAKLPTELQQRITAARKLAADQSVDRDHPFRVAAREAKAIWNSAAGGPR